MYKVWHRGGVTLTQDERATRARSRRLRLHNARCRRGRKVWRYSDVNGLVCVPKRGVLRRMQVPDIPHKWLYEPDENPKKKHHWDQSAAGFVAVGDIS